MNQKFSLITALLISSLTFFNVGCESEEDDKINGAQECLDNLIESDPSLVTKAQQCVAMVAGINSAQASVIRCSGYLIVGGLTNSDFATAFDVLDGTAPDKEAQLMVLLRQTNSAAADTSYAACQATGINGLTYVAGISRIGTHMYDIADSQGSSASATDIVDYCANPTGPPCDDAVVGEMADDAYDAYCLGDAKESDICVTLKTAITNGNNDYAAIAQALYDAL